MAGADEAVREPIDTVLSRDCVRTGMGGGGSASAECVLVLARDAREAVERRRASRADTGRITPSAFKPRREKRGAADCVSQLSSGLREVEGGGRNDMRRGSAACLTDPAERALGVGDVGRADLGLPWIGAVCARGGDGADDEA